MRNNILTIEMNELDVELSKKLISANVISPNISIPINIDGLERHLTLISSDLTRDDIGSPWQGKFTYIIN